MKALHDSTFHEIAALMHSAVGLYFSDSKQPLVSTRLAGRIQRLGLASY